MKTKTLIILSVILTIAFFSLFFPVEAKSRVSPELREKNFEMYRKVVLDTVNMVSNSKAQQLAKKYGMNIVNVTWEDTGRYKGSAVGPNISDMTIQIQTMNPKTEKYQLYCMPVIRYPNFSDKTCDVKMDRFYMLVGNEKGKKLKKITLKEFLGNPRLYLTNPKSWKGNKQSLLAKRDSHVLVSAQACFLPIPKQGKAEFNPVLFNYQSYKDNPAVLTILVTREGTSTTIIDNTRDAFQAGPSWGQRLFFNQKGERASLTGTRMSDYLSGKPASPGEKPKKPAGKKEKEGLNMVLLIQVPLKHKPMRLAEPCCPPGDAGGILESSKEEKKSDVENAVIGHGKVEGPFTEIDGMKIERDERFPVRVTIQFYKATSNGVMSAKDMESIAKQVKKVYADADYVGSLVVGGDTGRPTEYWGPKNQPPGWWDSFWKQYEKEHGMSREEAIKMLKNLLGPGWRPRTEKELENEVKKMEKKKMDN